MHGVRIMKADSIDVKGVIGGVESHAMCTSMETSAFSPLVPSEKWCRHLVVTQVVLERLSEPLATGSTLNA